jgi:hypothetical protein
VKRSGEKCSPKLKLEEEENEVVEASHKIIKLDSLLKLKCCIKMGRGKLT